MRLQAAARRRKMPFVKISAVTGDGLPELLHKMAEVIFAAADTSAQPDEEAATL